MGYRNAFLIIKGGSDGHYFGKTGHFFSFSISNSSVVSAEKSSITVAFETATFFRISNCSLAYVKIFLAWYRI
jgi:hypothetical protein